MWESRKASQRREGAPSDWEEAVAMEFAVSWFLLDSPVKWGRPGVKSVPINTQSLGFLQFHTLTTFCWPGAPTLVSEATLRDRIRSRVPHVPRPATASLSAATPPSHAFTIGSVQASFSICSRLPCWRTEEEERREMEWQPRQGNGMFCKCSSGGFLPRITSKTGPRG